jgi:hypothetical protein
VRPERSLQLEIDDVISLLRDEVTRTGGPAAWSRKTGIHRTTISKVICGLQSPTKGIISALGLRTVFVRREGETMKGPITADDPYDA